MRIRDPRNEFSDYLDESFGLPETMDIYSQPGELVKFSHPTNGWSYQQKEAAEFLMVGVTYEIIRVEVHNSHTRVYLKGFPKDQWFNSVLFENVE